jgi:hypothetical protein
VVAHQQHGPLLGDVLEAAHVGAEVQAREHPQAGKRLADVVGVALVEVRGGHAPLRLLGDRADHAGDHLGERGGSLDRAAGSAAVRGAVRG